MARGSAASGASRSTTPSTWPRDIGRRLERGKTFDACVRERVLRYAVILSYTSACGDAARGPRR